MSRKDQLLKELTEVSAPGGETADKKADKKAAVHDVSSAPSVRLEEDKVTVCLLYTSPSPRDRTRSRMPSSA